MIDPATAGTVEPPADGAVRGRYRLERRDIAAGIAAHPRNRRQVAIWRGFAVLAAMHVGYYAWLGIAFTESPSSYLFLPAVLLFTMIAWRRRSAFVATRTDAQREIVLEVKARGIAEAKVGPRRAPTSMRGPLTVAGCLVVTVLLYALYRAVTPGQ